MMTATHTSRWSERHSPEESLSAEELVRYSRHLLLPDVGPAGQAKLKSARVLVVGAGGLGSPVALYLAAAGVGTLGVVDFDRVDESNLQRQVLFGDSDIGQPKTEAAGSRISDLNPHVHVELFGERLTSANALGVMRGFDMVVDGSDNFPTRYLVNDAAVIVGIPDIYGSIHRFEGQASVFGVAGGPCYRCLFRDPPPPGAIPNCAEAGVLGVLPGLVGTIQATEALKLILGVGESLAGRLLLIDALTMSFRTIRIQRDPECPSCGEGRTPKLIDYDQLCAGQAWSIAEMTPAELNDRLRQGEDVDLVDVREDFEWRLGFIPGARHVPLGRVREELGTFDSGRDVVFYCHSGNRSARAAEMLAESGHPKTWNLGGGFSRWREDTASSPAR